MWPPCCPSPSRRRPGPSLRRCRRRFGQQQPVVPGQRRGCGPTMTKPGPLRSHNLQPRGRSKRRTARPQALRRDAESPQRAAASPTPQEPRPPPSATASLVRRLFALRIRWPAMRAFRTPRSVGEAARVPPPSAQQHHVGGRQPLPASTDRQALGLQPSLRYDVFAPLPRPSFGVLDVPPASSHFWPCSAASCSSRCQSRIRITISWPVAPHAKASCKGRRRPADIHRRSSASRSRSLCVLIAFED
mmetsp:Transcript_129303/g.374426  ORF Transcript_129303/g.374426 Transcript_129303/m.374426 type:complete len:246 (-) Transcript_129303:86-823(-)